MQRNRKSIHCRQIDEVQIATKMMSDVIHRSDILERHRWDNQIGISWNNQLNRITRVASNRNLLAGRIQDRQ